MKNKRKKKNFPRRGDWMGYCPYSGAGSQYRGLYRDTGPRRQGSGAQQGLQHGAQAPCDTASRPMTRPARGQERAAARTRASDSARKGERQLARTT